jgi:hypothetical protein
MMQVVVPCATTCHLGGARNFVSECHSDITSRPGRMVETWGVVHVYSQMTQIGVVPV